MSRKTGLAVPARVRLLVLQTRAEPGTSLRLPVLPPEMKILEHAWRTLTVPHLLFTTFIITAAYFESGLGYTIGFRSPARYLLKILKPFRTRHFDTTTVSISQSYAIWIYRGVITYFVQLPYM